MQKVIDNLTVQYQWGAGNLVDTLSAPKFEAGQRVSLFIPRNSPPLRDPSCSANFPPCEARQQPFMFGGQP